MNNVTSAVPRKMLTAGERTFLKRANRLLLDKHNGRIGSAALMDVVADWAGSRVSIGFQDYARRWIAEGNAKSKVADKLLKEIFGMGEPEPTPRKAA